MQREAIEEREAAVRRLDEGIAKIERGLRETTCKLSGVPKVQSAARPQRDHQEREDDGSW